MSIRERADTLEKLKACPKCTSWNHQKASCTTGTKCTEIVNGNKCNGAHSSMVHGSGNIYCGAVKPSYLSSSMALSSNNSQFPDLGAETLLLFQEIDVVGVMRPGLACWDNGSSRVLVTHAYAKACNMRSEKIVYRLDAVGNKGTPVEGCYYIFEVIRNDGSKHTIWAYGIEKIMEPLENIDLSSVRHLFPHLPDKAFASFGNRSPDILIGNNYLGLHPVGGSGRDCVGDLKAYQSDFGNGWVLGGTHPALRTFSCQFALSAYNLAKVNKCEVNKI